MKKITTAFLLLFTFWADIIAQKQAKTDLYDKAEEYIEDEKYDIAVETYQEIMAKNAEKSPDYAKAFYNIGYVLLLKKDSVKAKEHFLKILGSNFKESDRGGKGSGIMQEPYALYKHNACKNLAEIALWEKQFDKALRYTELFDKKYKYRHFCGNEYAANDIYTALIYAKCYSGLNQNKQALTKLLPLVCDNELASNEQLVNMTIQIITDTYSKEDIKAELDKADKTFRETKEKYKKNTYYHYFVTLMGAKIEVYDNFDLKEYEEEQKLTEKYRDNIVEYYKIKFKKSKFYKQLLSEISLN